MSIESGNCSLSLCKLSQLETMMAVSGISTE
jgi:hypothetical protein